MIANQDPLDKRIHRMAARWGYSVKELETALDGAKADPEGWTACCNADEALCRRQSKCCHTCCNLGESGKCLAFGMTPPPDFLSMPDVCDRWTEEVPF